MIVPEPRWPGVPQLRMRRPTLADLPPVVMPPPYRLRTYRTGDETAWLEIMRATIGPSWTAQRWEADVIGRPQFDPAGLFFAEHGQTIVGSACAWRLVPAKRVSGYVHMVGVSPAYQGHKLGYWLTLSTLHYFHRAGLRDAILDTEDHRLPAIELYLRLGFEPLPTHATHLGRWHEILRELGRPTS